ncbi:hydrogenase maturation nickel metallochaperone HypA [bacterium]|jgi:hydrogenase nickel incorporation protein HypA/HybF|nr:hydrogenase maturation nickel metallochaperone HypA [bacterium]MBT4551998.1 hydrogenase maturation nickel metallochaperone HypA [bacterium]MBT5989046.1 hydrogenase maturation nickel metallochaperone HypA [bacterium]MBT7087763.1 hydrogenase maturation nickel metallochaperone HypA [bacterium]
MHELSIIMEILKIAEQNAQQNNLKKIKKIKLKVGKLRHLVPDIMTVAFQTARQDTLADQAKLEIEEIPIKMVCQNCQKKFMVEDHVYFCPKCQQGSLQIVTGKEIILESIEGEKNGD